MNLKTVVTTIVITTFLSSGLVATPAFAATTAPSPAAATAPASNKAKTPPTVPKAAAPPALTKLTLTSTTGANGEFKFTLAGDVNNVKDTPAIILDKTNERVLTTCLTLSTCSATTSTPGSYYAQSGDVLSNTITLPTPATVATSKLRTAAGINTVDQSIQLSVDSPTFVTEADATLTATYTAADGTVPSSISYPNQHFYYFNLTDNTLLTASNSYDNPNIIGVNGWAAGDKSRNYQAFLVSGNQTNNVSKPSDLTNVIAESNTVSIARADWTLSIDTDYEYDSGAPYPGHSYWQEDLAANTNQALGNSGYDFIIHNLTTDEWVDVSDSFGYGVQLINPPTQNIVGYVAVPVHPAGDGVTVTGVTDVQATSSPVVLQRPDAVDTGTSDKGLGSRIRGGANPSTPCYQECAGDPVNTLTGEYYENKTDLKTNINFGPSLDFVRTYASSATAIDTGLGLGWTNNYEMKIQNYDPTATSSLITAASLEVVQENGSTLMFANLGNGLYATADDVQATLTLNNGVFTLTRNDGETFSFNSSTGQLVTLSDRNNNTLNLDYTGTHLAHITSAATGQNITVSWTGTHISSVTNSENETVNYTYNSSNQMISSTDTAGKIYTYSYTNGFLTKKTNPDGSFITNVYSTSTTQPYQVTSQTDANGNTTNFAYSGESVSTNTGATDETTTVDTPNGNEIIYSYEDGRIEEMQQNESADNDQETYYFYNAAGYQEEVSNPDGSLTHASYDANGNILTSTDANGNTTTYTYNSFNLPLTVTDGNGNVKSLTYDSKGNITGITDGNGKTTTLTDDAHGLVTLTTSPLGKTTSNVYNSAGFITSEINADNDITGYVYNNKGLLVSTTDSDGNMTSYTYDLNRNLLSTTDPSGAATIKTYDSMNRVLTIVDPLNRTETFTYDKNGNILTDKNVAGGTATYTYDKANNIATMVDPKANKTIYGYNYYNDLTSKKDALGKTTTYSYDWQNDLQSTTSPLSKITSQSYDSVGNLISVTDALGKTTNYTYDGDNQNITITDPLNQVTSFAYDNNGQPTITTRPDGKTETNAYNDDGYATTYTDADGHTAITTVDALGQPTQTSELGVTKDYTYDSVGNVTQIKNAADNSYLNYTYNSRNLLSGVTSSDNTTNYAYTYDAAGRRITGVDASGTTTYTYNNYDKVSKVAKGTTTQLQMAYDADANLTSLTYPNAEAVTYTYDALNRVSSLADANTGTINYTYTNDGNLSTIALPNGITSTYTYDADNQTKTISQKKGTTVIASYAYSYNAAGNMTAQNITNGTTLNTNYTYDNLSRLNAATTSGATSHYTFNDISTLASTPTSTETINANQEVTQQTTPGAGSTNYTYNNRGDRLTAATISSAGATTSTTTYGYNAADQLTNASVVPAPASTSTTTNLSYSYGQNGMLNAKTKQVGTATAAIANYTWLTQGSIPLLLNDGDTNYIYGVGSTPIAQIATGTNTASFLLADQLESVRTVTDKTGAVTGRFTYTDYGQDIVGSSARANTTKFGYAGQYLDLDTQLYNMRARWYDATSAVFMTVDPMISTTHSPYGYTAANPLQYVDPLGLTPWYELSTLNPFKMTSDDLGLVSTGLAFAAAGSLLIPPPAGEVMATVLGAGATIFALGSAFRAYQEGNPINMVLGIVGAIPGINVGADSARIAIKASESVAKQKETWDVIDKVVGPAAGSLGLSFAADKEKKAEEEKEYECSLPDAQENQSRKLWEELGKNDSQ